MNGIFAYFIFFSVGFVKDLILTFYYQAITKNHARLAAILSFVITLLDFLVLYQILINLQNQAVGSIIAYALGNAVGTYIVIRKNIQDGIRVLLGLRQKKDYLST